MIITPITLFASPYAMKLNYVSSNSLGLLEPVLLVTEHDSCYVPPHKQQWIKKIFDLYPKPEIVVPKEMAIEEFSFLPIFRLNKNLLRMRTKFDIVYGALDMNSYYIKDGAFVRICGCAGGTYYVFKAPMTTPIDDLTIADALIITDKWTIAMATLFNIRLFII